LLSERLDREEKRGAAAPARGAAAAVQSSLDRP
jgi:hypothetical protein